MGVIRGITKSRVDDTTAQSVLWKILKQVEDESARKMEHFLPAL